MGMLAWLAACVVVVVVDHGRRRLRCWCGKGVQPWLLEGVSLGSDGGHGARAPGLREKKGCDLG